VTFSGVSVRNSNDGPGAVTLKSDMLVAEIRFKYIGGGLKCRVCTDCSGRWGCVENGKSSMRLRLTDASNREILPAGVGKIKGLERDMLRGLTEGSDEMVWSLTAPIQLKAGTYRVWDREDLSNKGDSDNSGVIIYDITFTSAAALERRRLATQTVTTSTQTSTQTTSTVTVSLTPPPQTQPQTHPPQAQPP
jgi:hypothetical protein